jgi:hypothetical protein
LIVARFLAQIDQSIFGDNTAQQQHQVEQEQQLSQWWWQRWQEQQPMAGAQCHVPRHGTYEPVAIKVVLRHFHQHCYKSSPLWFFVGEGLSL